MVDLDERRTSRATPPHPGLHGRAARALALVVGLVAACNDSGEYPDASGDACGDECDPPPGSTSSGSTMPPPGPTSVTDSATSTSGMTAGDSTEGDTTAGPPAAMCECQVSSEDREVLGCHFEGLAQWVPGCVDTMPCERVTVECMRPGQDLYDCMDQELVYDEAALQCALETLRDQVPARLELDGTEDFGLFSGQDLYVVQVLGPQAVVSGCMASDVGFNVTAEPRRVELADPSQFDACLALPTPAGRYECLWDGLTGGEVLPVCEG